MAAFLCWRQSKARSPASCGVCHKINVLSELAVLPASASEAADNALGHSQRCLEAPAGSSRSHPQGWITGINQSVPNGPAAPTWKLRAAWWLHPQGWMEP